ncbi:MAG: type II toxin-antitoxin system VapC family toxin [Candidatus Tectomicrobia bacterium]|uniref:Type II toxin-antitoxin system VapC family toxin n=1 Tax=Tectimicrobiota bacterium TaxID=2528274 RepID=A0A937VYI5_UNCTE|nr:type II toxin-antitoxin system VapC family toxin [Candidatus Tectomicrobia bacterium]
MALRWGKMTGEAEQQGQPIPVLDGLLAATALVEGLTLVTRHTSHMQHTGALIFDPWTAS